MLFQYFCFHQNLLCTKWLKCGNFGVRNIEDSDITLWCSTWYLKTRITTSTYWYSYLGKKHHNPLIHYLYWCNMTAPDWCDCISVLKCDLCDCFSVSKDTSHGCRMWPWWWIKACPCWILVKKNPCQRVQKTKHKIFKNKKLVPLKFRRITLYVYTLYYFHVASKAS